MCVLKRRNCKQIPNLRLRDGNFKMNHEFVHLSSVHQMFVNFSSVCKIAVEAAVYNFIQITSRHSQHIASVNEFYLQNLMVETLMHIAARFQ